MVLCAAHAVLQDGSVVGAVGCLTLALVANAHGTPFCVTAPHYCFHHADAMHADAARDVGPTQPTRQPTQQQTAQQPTMQQQQEEQHRQHQRRQMEGKRRVLEAAAPLPMVETEPVPTGQDEGSASSNMASDATSGSRGAASAVASTIERESPLQDCTPAALVTRLYSDVGALTPSAVCDFLYMLHTHPDG